MPGSAQPWDQSEDPRDKTVDLPRIDLANYGNGTALPESGPPSLTRPIWTPPGDPASRNGRSSSPLGSPEPRGRVEPGDRLEPADYVQPPGRNPGPPGHHRPDSTRHPYPRLELDGRLSALFRPPPEPRSPRQDAAPTPSVPPESHAHLEPTGLPQQASQPRPAAPPGRTAPPGPMTPAEPAVTPEAALQRGSPASPESVPPSRAHLQPEAGPTPESALAAQVAPHAGPAVTLTSAPGPAVPPEPAQAPHLAASAPPGADTAVTMPVAGRGQDRYPRSRPAPGSVADLRARLDRLPDGHPSSPYEDDGLAKPWPYRLKQLELGLPTPEREATEPGAGAPQALHQADPLGTAIGECQLAPETSGDGGAADARMRDDAAAANDDRRAGETRAVVAPDTEQHDIGGDRPAGPAPRAERARALAESDLRRRARHGSGASSQAPEVRPWRDMYATPPAASAVGHPDRGMPAEDGPVRGQRTQGGPSAPPGTAAWDTNTLQVPATSRAADQPGTGLTGNQAKLVDGMVAACRAAEGRNLFDDYGERGLTPVMRRIAAQLSRGGLAPGSEADSLKSPDRMAAKLARLIARHPGRTAEELAADISDGVRYAFAFDPGDYTEGTWFVHRSLKAQGFELEARRNRWDSPEYKGVWTRWRDPAHDLSFEVQFHTAASWDVVRRTHRAYVQITDPATPAAERASLRARQVAAAAAAKAPPHCAEIADFGRRLGDA